MAKKRAAKRSKKTAAELRKELAAERKKLAAAKKELARQKKLASARAKKRKARRGAEPVRTSVRRYKTRLGAVTHVAARESEGEPQYAWKELEELAAPKMKRTKKKRWARLVVEFDKRTLLFPSEYRRLRGKPIIRTGWHPAHELVGKAAEVVDKLQQSGAVTPRMKVVFVERAKKPGRRMF